MSTKPVLKVFHVSVCHFFRDFASDLRYFRCSGMVLSLARIKNTHLWRECGLSIPLAFKLPRYLVCFFSLLNFAKNSPLTF
ncbi:hypothetical protein B0T17DRAFT_542861 [Bombardia bombarda]|uniref:Uncharacterized protein n=1 Tax=Bombardia bombarda TaxID=252184 RepID=A0AA39TMW9_9PEZI|nr:hypothetical protein B0T17DRAFT_542861 [Bombardia bombarda]